MKHAYVTALKCMSCHEFGMKWKTNTGVRLWVRPSASHHAGQDCNGSGCHSSRDKFALRPAVPRPAAPGTGTTNSVPAALHRSHSARDPRHQRCPASCQPARSRTRRGAPVRQRTAVPAPGPPPTSAPPIAVGTATRRSPGYVIGVDHAVSGPAAAATTSRREASRPGTGHGRLRRLPRPTPDSGCR
jgi:hypothetical protein